MDEMHFDELSRSLARCSTRRGVLKGLAGGLAAGLVALTGREADAQTRLPNGSVCARATQCASLKCVDGVCCNAACTGQCESCATGTCTPVSGAPAGNRPACPGSGICAATCDGVTRTHCAAWPGTDVVCGAATCADGVATTLTCGGNGACVPTTTSCGPYGCGPAGCLTGCTSDAECAGTAFCAGGVCQGDRPLGAPCAGPDQCQSGICANGVCCASTCSGACEACNLPGTEGFCTEVPDGGACDGGTCCDGECVDTSSNLEHCGVCDHACRLAPAPGSCEAEPICQAGACGFTPLPRDTECHPAAGACDVAEVCDGVSTACPADAFLPDLVPCGGACVDLATDPANCGACGFRCDDGVACVGGICELVALELFGPAVFSPRITVNDDLTVYLNGVAIFVDADGLLDFHAPIAFTARTGDTLRIVATNSDQPAFSAELRALALRRVRDGAVQVLDATGFPSQVTVAGVFYDRTFTIEL